MVRFLFALLIACRLVPPAAAAAPLRGPYEAEIVRVIDGDSFEARVRIWLDQDVTVIVRLAGVDAAEMDAPCVMARVFAMAARASLVLELDGGRATLFDVERDKYGGRVVARAVGPKGDDLAATLLAAGLVRPYRGRRPDWCGTARAATVARARGEGEGEEKK